MDSPDDAPTTDDPETVTELEAETETITVTAEDVAKVAAAAADATRQAWLAALVPLTQYRVPMTEWDRAPAIGWSGPWKKP